MISMAEQLKAFMALFVIKGIGNNKAKNILETSGS